MDISIFMIIKSLLVQFLKIGVFYLGAFEKLNFQNFSTLYPSLTMGDRKAGRDDSERNKELARNKSGNTKKSHIIIRSLQLYCYVLLCAFNCNFNSAESDNTIGVKQGSDESMNRDWFKVYYSKWRSYSCEDVRT